MSCFRWLFCWKVFHRHVLVVEIISDKLAIRMMDENDSIVFIHLIYSVKPQVDTKFI